MFLPGVDDLAELVAKSQAFDFVDIKILAHRLKTSCGIVGATAMLRTCAAVELAASTEDYRKVTVLLGQLTNEFEETKEILAAEIA